MNQVSELFEKIEKSELKVGIIGLGYVGLPLAVAFARQGFVTTGLEVSNEKVQLVNDGENYIADIDNDEFKELVAKRFLSATTDFSVIGSLDFIAICVPSPLDRFGQPDMSYIRTSVESVGAHLTKPTIIVLESTTYPGTTEELVKPLLEKQSGLTCESDFYLGYSPERVDPGNEFYKTGNTPKVIGGIGKDASNLICAVYKRILSVEVYPVSSPSVAEMEKLLENAYRYVNIAFINEMAMLCERMKINIWEVISAANTKPYGFQAFYPGPGPGGHCIPLDPSYLSWKAKEFVFHTSIIEAAASINDRMPEYCVTRTAALLNTVKKPINGSKILVLGVAYKPNIDDYRESAALKLIDLLEKRGAEVFFYDPYVAEYTFEGKKRIGLSSIDEQSVSSFDIVIIATAHSNINYALVQMNAHMVFDTKNAMDSITERANIFLL